MINKNYVYGILTLLFANPAYAALDCKQQPTCESLGYSNTSSVANCPADGIISCPFDTSYKKCVVTTTESYDCASVGFTKSDKTAWCQNVIECPIDKSYTLCKESYDCATVGFTKSDKTAWCKNVIECPIDKSYTLCKWLDCTVLGFTKASCPTGGVCDECIADENATKKYKLTGCQSGYVLNVGTCYKTYASCTAANYYETNTGGCGVVSIYLNDGTQKNCYSCSNSSSSSSSSSSSDVGGSDTALNDCYETCADKCDWNVTNCAGYDACIHNCDLTYGFNMEAPQTLLLAQTNKAEFKKLYTEALDAVQDEADCVVYI